MADGDWLIDPAATLSYQVETGVLGALVQYGRPGLEIAQAAGWSPGLCERPINRALSAWVAARIEAGEGGDLIALVDHLQLQPIAGAGAPAEQLQALISAPTLAPIPEGIPAAVKAMIRRAGLRRLQLLQAELQQAAAAGDMAAAARIGRQIARELPGVEGRGAEGAGGAPGGTERTPGTDGGEDRPEPPVLASLRRIPKRAREDVRVQAEVVFREDSRWAGRLRYDRLRGRQVIGGQPWSDADDTAASLWISRTYGLRLNTAAVRELLAKIAADHGWNPLQSWLGGLAWDGVPRIDSWLQRGLAVEDGPLVRAIGRRWLIQAVARAMQPGCQADAVLVLIGEQGICKSSAVAALAGRAFFSESPLDLQGDLIACQDQVHSAWIHDLSEGTDVRRAEVDRLKQFLSVRSDNYRRKYHRHHEDRPRYSVFVSTTNDDRFLPDDPAGARRFWPVRCARGDVAWIGLHRDQLWAEARVAWERGGQWHLTPEESAALLDHQGDYRQDDALSARVCRWLQQPDTRRRWWCDDGPRDGRQPLTTEAVMTGPMGLSPVAMSRRSNEQRAGDILRKLGYTRRRIRSGTGLAWGYLKVRA